MEKTAKSLFDGGGHGGAAERTRVADDEPGGDTRGMIYMATWDLFTSNTVILLITT